MPVDRSSPSSCYFRVLVPFVVSAGLANRRGQRVDSLVELIVLDQNRRQEPDDGSPRGQDEDASLLHSLNHGGNWLLELDGLHHAPAANLANLRQSKVANALLKTGPGVGRACMERFVSEHLEGRGPGGADQWIAGEGAPMASLGHSLADRLRRNGHADWQAVGDRLREAHDVGDDVLTGEGKWAPGPKPGLDLVTYKKDASGVAPSADAFQIAVGGHPDAARPRERRDDQS